MEENNIRLNGVHHIYSGGRVALDHIDLAIGTGLFGLLGENGAGKSTLMRIMCTLLAPTEGTVTVGEFDIFRHRRQIRELIGYLPQDFGAWRLHSVEEVLDTLARLSGLRVAKVRRSRVLATIESVGLSKVAGHKVKSLSGGMLRRLGVAQALVHEPRILILDEPTVGLDPEERLRFRQLMAELGRERIVLLSTHIMADLGTGCDKLAVLHKGRILFHGSPGDLVRLAQGKVIELVADQDSEAQLASCMEIVRRTSLNGQVRLRGVRGESTQLISGAAVQDVTLEEAYLALMIDFGHTSNVAARTVLLEQSP